MSTPTLKQVNDELVRMELWAKEQFLVLPESKQGQYIESLRRAKKRLEAEATVEQEPFAFQRGDLVRKVGGDYQLEGVIVAAFHKTSGAARYVVEAEVPAGLLHIFSKGNLEPR